MGIWDSFPDVGDMLVFQMLVKHTFLEGSLNNLTAWLRISRDNRLLGSFNLDGIPPAPRGVGDPETSRWFGEGGDGSE